MNIYRPQKPYVFRPPKYSPWLMPVVYWLAKVVLLRRKFRIERVRVDGLDKVVQLVRSGHSVLVAPNHADHADPSLLLTVGRQRGLRFHFMAAREGFEQGAIQAFVLQRAGAFSIDREGADLGSIKMAIQILQKGQVPLVIFPEGEIWHHHERLDALNDGVATILLRAAAKRPPEKKAYLVPTVIKISCDAKVQETFSDRLSRLEDRVTWKPRPEMSLLERVERLGSGLLALKEEEFLGRSSTGDLQERIANLQKQLVSQVESKHHVEPSPGHENVPERIKNMRGRIRKQLTDSQTALSPAEESDLYNDLDTLFLASQLYSYSGRYLREQPNHHRVAETIFKLEEDLLGQGSYMGPRHALVRFDDPLDVNQFLLEHSLNAKSGVRPLTSFLSHRLQKLLDESG